MSMHRTPSCSGEGRSVAPQAVRCVIQRSGLRRSTARVAAIAALLSLAACATQVSSAVAQAPTTPGFLLGLWHGFIFPVAWVLSLFLPEVAVYAVPNNGGWYDFGFFVGVTFLGVGARKTRTVYVTRRSRG